MSPEAQRIAIAEACPNLFWVYRSSTEAKIALRPARARVFRLGEHPAEGDKESDPLSDLNACHEMEKGLTCGQCFYYRAEIQRLVLKTAARCFADFVFGATAAQRCEAFLRTIGKWEEAP